MKKIFKVVKKEKNAKLGVFKTVHKTFKTPCFMNVLAKREIKKFSQ